jgi:hypothetical protein
MEEWERKTNSRCAFRHVFRRALRCGGRVPEKISHTFLRNPVSIFHLVESQERIK